MRISLCKARNAANRHTAAGRDVRREVLPPAGATEGTVPDDWALEVMDAGPTPADAALFREEVAHRLDALPEELRPVAVWRLEGHTNEEIAGRFGLTVRSVETRLARIRRRWQPGDDAAARRPGQEGVG